MKNLVSILHVSESLDIPVNDIFSLIKEKNIELLDGYLSHTAVEQIKDYTGITETVEEIVSEPITPLEEVGEEVTPVVLPYQKRSKRHNPSAIHQFVDAEHIKPFISMLEESGEDTSDMPTNHVLGGLTYLIGQGIINRWFSDEPLEKNNLITGIYPVKTPSGHDIPDNIWFVRGADTYLNWNDQTREKVRDLIQKSRDHVKFAYRMREIDGDVGVSAAMFLGELEEKKFYERKTMERFKGLANGLLLYQKIKGSKLEEDIISAYEQSHKRNLEFSHWLHSQDIFKEMQKNIDKTIKDNNAYLAAILFSLKDHDPKLNINLSAHQNLGRTYGSFGKMEDFREKGKIFYTALNRIKNDVKAAMKNDHKIDENLFIANTLKKKTFDYFYKNYSGRGIQYATFVSYAAAALLLESDDNPENSLYAGFLSKLTKERGTEKIDRLLGRGEKGERCPTSLVRVLQETPDSRSAYQEISNNWRKYKKVLKEENCWVGKARNVAFSQKEISKMYDIVDRFPSLFT